MTTTPHETLRLFHTGVHPCGYWPERDARDLVIDPNDARLPGFYPQALRWGFRRSGDIVYRPHCAHCRACVAVRVPVQAFRPSRSQRRALSRNTDIQARIVPPGRTDERLALYQRYLQTRHPDGGMQAHGAAEFDQFLLGRWADSRFLELRIDDTLVALAVTDLAEDGLSAVYTCYDPAHAARGLGTLAICHQIAWARREGRRHLYLGYWIDGHGKMDYKRTFRPLEAFDGRRWHPFDTPPPSP